MTLEQMYRACGGGGGVVTPVFVQDLGPFRAIGNVNSTPLADPLRTIDRSLFGPPVAGDILVACRMYGAHGGESLGSIRTPTFQFWSNQISAINRTASDTGELAVQIELREATGTTEDTALLFSNGPFPCGWQIVRMGGSVFTWPGTITSDNENSEQLADAAGLIQEGGMGGGFLECMEFVASSKTMQHRAVCPGPWRELRSDRDCPGPVRFRRKRLQPGGHGHLGLEIQLRQYRRDSGR